MNHRKTAEELRDHAALAVAKVRSEINDAFKSGLRRGFSRAHIREVLLRKGYRENDIAYVEQLLDGSPQLGAPQRKVTFGIQPMGYLAIAILALTLLGIGIFRALDAQQDEVDAVRMAQLQHSTDAKTAIQQLRSQQQTLTVLADQLAAFPSLTANLAPEDRDKLLLSHSQELRDVAGQIEQPLTALDAQVSEI